MSNTTVSCQTSDKSTQTPPLYNQQFFDDLYKAEFPKTGVESLCGETYKKLYDLSLEKISKLETAVADAKLAHNHDHLGMVRKLAEEYETRLSNERLKHFRLENEIEQLNFKYRKLLLDYEKMKIILKSRLA